MSKYTLIISSKNKKSLTKFSHFFFHNYKNNSQIFTKLFRKKKIKENISVLKSPHVNKTAQEKFKHTHFFITITFATFEIKKELFILKKINNQIFPDLKIIVKGVYKKRKELLLPINSYICFNKLTVTKKNSSLLLKKIMLNLKTLDYSGKIEVN